MNFHCEKPDINHAHSGFYELDAALAEAQFIANCINFRLEKCQLRQLFV